MSATGSRITWKSDRNTKFRNPQSDGDLCDAAAFNSTSFTKVRACCRTQLPLPLSLTDTCVQPPNWPVPACRLGQSLADAGTYFAQSSDYNSSGRGYQNEDLIVWMRTAGTVARVLTGRLALCYIWTNCVVLVNLDDSWLILAV